MRLSISFSLLLAFHLIVVFILATLIAALSISLASAPDTTQLPWAAIFFFVFGIALWHNHRRVLAEASKDSKRVRTLWIKSTVFMLVALVYYPFGLRAYVTIPNLQPPAYWTLFFLPLILSVYMLILSIIALICATKATGTLRPGSARN
ncbi:MAG: hypothetical protein QE274_00070 [Verrucomicrobiaceae bacterium]|nr:hypothetical protein [Verrucomicrobiaceae bacterium]